MSVNYFELWGKRMWLDLFKGEWRRYHCISIEQVRKNTGSNEGGIGNERNVGKRGGRKKGQRQLVKEGMAVVGIREMRKGGQDIVWKQAMEWCIEWRKIIYIQLELYKKTYSQMPSDYAKQYVRLRYRIFIFCWYLVDVPSLLLFAVVLGVVDYLRVPVFCWCFPCVSCISMIYAPI